MINSLRSRIVASTVIASLVATPVLAKSAGSLQDLVGANAAGGETQLRARGFEHARTTDDGARKISYWWNSGKDDCIEVRTFDGRYTSLADVAASDCGKKSGSGSGAAVAAGVIGAIAIGALLMSRKDKNRPNQGGYQQDWQQVEVYNLQTGTLRIFDRPSTNARVRDEVPAGTQLRNDGCEDYNGESWCEVSTLDNRSRGWARDRYLRPSYGSGQYPDYGDNRGDLVEVYGVAQALTISSTPSKTGYVVGRINRGAQLRKMGCEYANGEQWCRVSTLDGRMYGWARERYLRPVGGGGYYPGDPGYGGGMTGSIQGIEGTDNARAFNELRARGFENVDSFSSGRTNYRVYFYRPNRLCVQTTANNRRILDIRDIGGHPRCQ